VEKARIESAQYYKEVVKALEQFAASNPETTAGTKVLTGIDVLKRDTSNSSMD
jgi:hypothetical protein